MVAVGRVRDMDFKSEETAAVRVGELFHQLPGGVCVSGSELQNRMVKRITENGTEHEAGLLYVVCDPVINLAELIRKHPDAAGFIATAKQTERIETKLPVLAVEEPDNAAKDLMMQVQPGAIATEAAKLLLAAENRSVENLLELLKPIVEAEFILQTEHGEEICTTNKALQFPEADSETAGIIHFMYGQEPAKIAAVRTDGLLLDRYCFEECTCALRGVLVSGNGRKEQVQEKVFLICEGQYGIAAECATRERKALLHNTEILYFAAKDGVSLLPWKNSIREFCISFGRIGLIGMYGTDIVMIYSKVDRYREMSRHCNALAEYLAVNRIPAVLVQGMHITPGGLTVRSFHEHLKQYLRDAETVFPCSGYVRITQLQLIRYVRNLMKERSFLTDHYRSMIDLLVSEGGSAEIIETLAVYILDKQMSAADTATSMYVHRNTIKYRMQKAEDVLGIEIGDPADMRELMTALVMYRIEKTGTEN